MSGIGFCFLKYYTCKLSMFEISAAILNFLLTMKQLVNHHLSFKIFDFMQTSPKQLRLTRTELFRKQTSHGQKNC